MVVEDEFIWESKYRPQTVNDCILPDVLKKKADAIIKSRQIQNMLFYSGPGTGKTTLAKAICQELGIDYIVINGSKEGRLMETVRGLVMDFATSMSLYGESGDIKVIIYDEFDNAPNDVQMALRGIMDDVSATCRFILTGNYISKIIKPIRSRTPTVDFSIPKDDQQYIMGLMLKRTCDILDIEKIPYDKKVVAKFIMKTFPDYRKVLNEIQIYSTTGKIDAGLLEMTLSRYEILVENILNKDFKACEAWMNANNYDGSIYSLVLKEMRNKIDGDVYGEMILIADTQQYRNSFAVDPDITLKAFCIMAMGAV